MRPYPLEGYRLIDFGWVYSAPLLSSMLADMGAEVIKVESRKRLDANRRVGRPLIGGQPLPGDETELVPLFQQVNRNKLGIGVDLKHPQAATLLRELVRKSDAVVENFTPGVMAKLGLGYEALREVKPDIIMISLSSAGQEGPLAQLRGYGFTLTSLGGLDSVVGYPGEPVLGAAMPNLSDPSAAVHGALLVLAALYHRERTGQGQYIDLSQLESITSLLGEPMMDYTLNGRVAGPQGNQHPTMAPHGIYPCRGEDKWLSIAIGSEEEWQSFCRALGYPPWTQEERFTDSGGRLAHRDELDRMVSQWTRRYSPYEATEILQRAGVAAAPVLSIEEQHQDPHFQARVHLRGHHPLLGPQLLFATPWKLSDTPGGLRRPAPLLGQHNEYVFGQLLGLSQDQIAQLAADGVIEG